MNELPERLLGGRRASAREVIAYIDAAELLIERREWEPYVDRLTKTERAKLLEDKSVFTRPRKAHLPRPELANNQWIAVVRNLWVKVRLRVMATTYVFEVTHRQDEHSGGALTNRPISGSPLREIATLVPFEGQRLESEPAKMPPSHVKHLPSSLDARRKYAELQSEDTQRRLRRALIEEVREAALSPVEVELMRRRLVEIREARVAA